MSVLLLAIAMLGKFNDVRNRTLMSSRYVAWERTVWTDSDAKKNLVGDSATTEGWSGTYGSPALASSKLDTELKAEVMQRLFVGNNAPVAGADRQQNRLASSKPAMWQDYGGKAFLGSANAVTVGTNVSADPATSRTGSALAHWQVPTAGGVPYDAQLALPTRTLQSGTVSLSVAQDSDVLKRLWPKNGLLPAFTGLTFSDTNVLMTNTWAPNGSASNKALFSRAVPAANVALVPSAGYLGLQKYAPEISSLQFGRVQQDVVPSNRLSQ
ncbi:hypothetical protein [Paraburkholderia sp. BCC1886]|uniref:hypothetical protein n=1 Tax=Paraburkholderia sp. BCC1886 TaxID=2562670 RepID=UPI0021B4233F|nr:hypothetical protein [Paraburkholderia sp. BCC1886]